VTRFLKNHAVPTKPTIPTNEMYINVYLHIMWAVKYIAVVITTTSSSSGVSLRILSLFLISLYDRIRYYVHRKCKYLKNETL